MKHRIVNAIKLAWWAFQNPQTLNIANFKMLSDLMGLIMEVANKRRHRMTRIAFIHPDDGEEKEIVSIWAGAGIAAEPLKRIAELLEENRKLKSLLGERANNNQNIDATETNL